MEFCLWCYKKGGFSTQVYLWETCSDVQERSGTSKLIWECCISYSTSIDVVFGSLKTTFQQVETDVDFVISNISSIFNDNCWFTNYYFCIEWRIQQLTERNTIISKYWRNIANYKIYIRFYLLKLPACGFKGPKNNINKCLI